MLLHGFYLEKFSGAGSGIFSMEADAAGGNSKEILNFPGIEV